jgi:alpha-L-rhamnosidase
MIELQKGRRCRCAWTLLAVVCVCSGFLTHAYPLFAQALRPAALRVDEMTTPLGIDDGQPRFSWQLRDARQGARQTAYRLLVATEPGRLLAGKADVWDSGRVESGQSVAVRYGGPAIAPSARYYWRVLVWDQDGKAAPESEVSWWESGLMHSGWKAKWIGYETAQEHAVRYGGAKWITSPDAKGSLPQGTEERIAYRAHVEIAKPVKQAVLHVAAENTASAWINGKRVMERAEQTPWKQLPWKKSAVQDVTAAMAHGGNTIAIESTHYLENSNGDPIKAAPPMQATLVVTLEDGSVQTWTSRAECKASLHPAEGWTSASFDDSRWKNAVEWIESKADFGPGDDPLGQPWPAETVKALRHGFESAGPVKSARLYVTALGGYEMYLNGKRIGDDVLAPGWTDYRERVEYQTYDVTANVVPGANVLAALLAPGWYSTPLKWFQQPNSYGLTPPALLAELRIEHTDGSVEWVATDDGWKARRSAIVQAELYDGETYDARLELPRWNQAGADDAGWLPVTLIDPKPVTIEAQEFQAIRAETVLAAKTMKEPKPGVYIYDFGQNMAGVERIHVQGGAGTDVQVRVGEDLNPDGTLYTENLRTAKATDHFILAGKGAEEFQPRFTFHGFRYVEISGLKAEPGKNAVEAVVLHTDAPFTTQLKTGSAMLNQLWSNILWGQRSNFVGVPTDCPQRDERMGWTGDAEVFWRAASYNADLAAFSRKFAGDMRGTQDGTPYYGIIAPGSAMSSQASGAGWSDAGVIVPWTSWMQSGDTRIVEQNWDAMETYLGAIEKANPDGLWKHEAGIPYGDWLSPEGPTLHGLVATAYWAYDATLMRQMAHAVHNDAEEARLAKLYDRIRSAFIAAYVHADGSIPGADYGPSPFGQLNNPNAKAKGGDTQTGYVLALNMGLVPEELRAAAAKKLAAKIEANHGLLGTGFLGTPYLLATLAETGHGDLAYKLLLNTEYPSWGYLVEHGATTMWERWNGDQMRGDPSMNSYNHYAYGAVADWIYRYAAGVDASPLDAGFHTVYLHPLFDRRLGSVDFKFASPYGEIASAWKVEGDRARWTVTIPPNANAWLRVSDAEAVRYQLNGEPLTRSKLAKAATVAGKSGYELGAGTHSLVVGGVE